MAKFYLSSTYEDLKDYRQQVFEILQKMGHSVVGMENYTASWVAPLERCLEDVAECDYYLGIFAWRYGHIPENNNPEGKSITELEYLKAVDMEIKPLLFILHKNAQWSLDMVDSDVTQIKELRRSLSKKLMVGFFKNLKEFTEKVEKAVSETLDDSAHKRKFWERYAKLILCLAIAFVLALFTAYRIYLAYWPREYINDWAARFTKAENLDDHWDYPKGMWSTEPGQMVGTNKDDEALLVKGQEMGVPNDLGDKVFYDFKASFKVRFKGDSIRMAWVLRAQRDKASGYLFELRQEDADLFLYGWIYERKHEVESLGKKRIPFNIPFGELRESKGLRVNVSVVDNKFDYVITFEDDKPDGKSIAGQPFVVDFKDDPSNVRWPWGTIGFLVRGTGDVMRVEYVYVYPLPKNP